MLIQENCLERKTCGVTVEHRDDFRLVRFTGQVTENDISMVIRAVKEALLVKIKNVAIVCESIPDADLSCAFTGLLVLCEEMVRHRHGRFALIVAPEDEHPSVRMLCMHLHIPVYCSEVEFQLSFLEG